MQNLNFKFKTDLLQRCYSLSLIVIAFGDQLLRSIISIGANLTEGRAASSRLDFKKYYEIALKSANESKYWLELLRDSRLANEIEMNKILAEVTEIANMLGKSVLTLKSKKF